jgi:hypothetical protein
LVPNRVGSAEYSDRLLTGFRRVLNTPGSLPAVAA